MKHLFVVNPAAGKGKTLRYVPQIEKLFEEINEEYHIEVTQKPGHATEIVRSYVSKGKHRVYSIGGDGTLNEVLNGMAGSDSTLAIIPSGSGNDFIRSLNSSGSFEDIIRNTVHGSEISLDMARVNGKYFINISSLGFDAEVAYNMAKFKKLPFVKGSLAYIASVLLTLVKCKSYSLEISYDGKTINSNALLVAIANGKYYGGGMLAVPIASLDDGLLDICLVRKLSRLRILKFFPKFIKGQHMSIPEVSFSKSKMVEITSKAELSLNIDGEIERVKKAVFEIIPKGIVVIMPKESSIKFDRKAAAQK